MRVVGFCVQVLANQVRTAVSSARASGNPQVAPSFNPSTANMLKKFLSHNKI
jgi:hypothetical protein